MQKEVHKKNPYGYVAPRPNFMTIRDQEEELTAYGVNPSNILNNENGIDEAIRFCGENHDLVVYSATVFGTVREYDRIIAALAKNKANLIVIRADKLTVNAVGSLAYIDGKKDLNLRNAMLGRKHGRKKGISSVLGKKIINFCQVQGNSQLKAAEKYKVSTTQVSKIMNGTYFTKTRDEEKYPQ